MAGQVRNIGAVEKVGKPVSDNEWEDVKGAGGWAKAIKDWIDKQMRGGRSCTIVLIGSEAANRKWVKYEIEKSRELDMGACP